MGGPDSMHKPGVSREGILSDTENLETLSPTIIAQKDDSIDNDDGADTKTENAIHDETTFVAESGQELKECHQCKENRQVHNGKIDENDGNWYCTLCWKSFYE